MSLNSKHLPVVQLLEEEVISESSLLQLDIYRLGGINREGLQLSTNSAGKPVVIQVETFQLLLFRDRYLLRTSQTLNILPAVYCKVTMMFVFLFLLAGKPELRGYNLSPLSTDEVKAINSLLKR